MPASSGQIIFNGEYITKLKATEVVKRGITLVPEGREYFQIWQLLKT